MDCQISCTKVPKKVLISILYCKWMWVFSKLPKRSKKVWKKVRQFLRKKYVQNLENIDRYTFTFTMTGAGKNTFTFTMTRAWKTLSLSQWPELEKHFHFHNDRGCKNANYYVSTLSLSQWPELEKISNFYVFTLSQWPEQQSQQIGQFYSPYEFSFRDRNLL